MYPHALNCRLKLNLRVSSSICPMHNAVSKIFFLISDWDLVNLRKIEFKATIHYHISIIHDLYTHTYLYIRSCNQYSIRYMSLSVAIVSISNPSDVKRRNRMNIQCSTTRPDTISQQTNRTETVEMIRLTKSAIARNKNVISINKVFAQG